MAHFQPVARTRAATACRATAARTSLAAQPELLPDPASAFFETLNTAGDRKDYAALSTRFNVNIECARRAAGFPPEASDRKDTVHTEPIVEREPPIVYGSTPFVLTCEDVAAGRTQADIDWTNAYSPVNSVIAMCDDTSDGSEDDDQSTSDSQSDSKSSLPTTRHEGACCAMATTR